MRAFPIIYSVRSHSNIEIGKLRVKFLGKDFPFKQWKQYVKSTIHVSCEDMTLLFLRYIVSIKCVFKFSWNEMFN